jgi:hypothetical protein
MRPMPARRPDTLRANKRAGEPPAPEVARVFQRPEPGPKVGPAETRAILRSSAAEDAQKFGSHPSDRFDRQRAYSCAVAAWRAGVAADGESLDFVDTLIAAVG